MKASRSRGWALVGSVGAIAMAYACGGESKPPPAAPVAVEIPPSPSAAVTTGAGDAGDPAEASAPDEPNAQPMVGLTMRADGASGMTADDAAGIIGALQADGGAGFGTGSGRLGGSNRPPAVGQGGTSVQGSLSRDVIQRMVRVNVGRIRQCYEHALQKAPNLTGRVSIRFVIGPTGKVVQASDSGSTLGDPGVIACVLAAVRRISFPSPTGGGPVVVTYPSVFSPGTGASPATPPAKPAPKTGNP